MKNSIKISTQFDFRGETYRPEAVIDLDLLMARQEQEPNFYLLLAKDNGIGLYSYEYEVLESSELVFSEPVGEAVEFLNGNHFDLVGFGHHWQKQQQLEELREIARELMGVESLEHEPRLQAALMAAYRLGREQVTD